MIINVNNKMKYHEKLKNNIKYESSKKINKINFVVFSK